MSWAVAPDGKLISDFRVRVLGHTVVLDRDHRVVYSGPPVGYDRLAQYIEEAI